MSRLVLPGLALTLISLTTQAADWKPAAGRLMTRWAKDVSPETVHPEYPRPQLVRSKWTNLNGLWEYTVRPRAETELPKTYDGQILVPFPIESALSGVMKRVEPGQRVWYRRMLPIRPSSEGDRWLLHFGAVDWQAVVYVNGKEVARHQGGYTPFSVDISGALRDSDQELIVAVLDPTDKGTQPRGKQIGNPHGIWYTPTTGIWQTVWLEPVKQQHVQHLQIVPDVDAATVRITVNATENKAPATIVIQDGGQTVAKVDGRAGDPANIPMPDAKLWSPDSPHLYSVSVTLQDGDRVESYFGMRKIALGKDDKGITRLLLNGKPLFQFGPLDQGFWPDGLYTAPTEEALKYDIEITKQLGFNMIRKHVKVEPDRWYYWCDKLGMLVWQDMPNGDAHVAPGKGEITRTKESAANFEAELAEMIRAKSHFPSIVMWVPFNEGWGQYDTARIVDQVRKLDPTRLVNCASGWNDMPGVGDVHDIHVYPGPASPLPEDKRAAVLGEYGGLGLPLRGHTWQDEKNWGYRSYTSKEALTEAYVALINRMRPLIGKPGLSAAVYTQTTDVEIEVNGLLTYDRAEIKPDAKAITAANQKVYLPPPVLTVLVPTSQQAGEAWRYTFEKPGEDWFQESFDPKLWTLGTGGFGRADTPGSVVRTQWTTPDIWAVRTFELKEVPKDGEINLTLHHDEDAEVYLNGVLAAKVTGYVTDYVPVPLSAAARKALRAGKNTLAVHCHQTGGGQYVDVGLSHVQEAR